MRLRSGVIAIVLTTTFLTPALSATAAQAKPASKPAAVQKVKPAKPAKKVKIKFSASGTVGAVDAAAGTVTVVARGGTKDVRGRTVTVVAPATARIVLDEERATLADLATGFKITVTGTRAGAVYTAVKIQASAPEVDESPEDGDEPVE